MRFTGKRVFVTGAAAGIGEATVQLFREEGANVVGVDIAEAPGIGHCDVSDPSSVTAAMEAAIEELGGLDILANVARLFSQAAFCRQLRNAQDSRGLFDLATGHMG